jgi:hypothetical protein
MRFLGFFAPAAYLLVALLILNNWRKKMKKLATATVTALLIAATTSLAMAQGTHGQRYYNYAGSSVQGKDYNTSPASTNSGLEQQR